MLRASWPVPAPQPMLVRGAPSRLTERLWRYRRQGPVSGIETWHAPRSVYFPQSAPMDLVARHETGRARAGVRERARYWFDTTMSRRTPGLIGWLGLARVRLILGRVRPRAVANPGRCRRQPASLVTGL